MCAHRLCSEEANIWKSWGIGCTRGNFNKIQDLITLFYFKLISTLKTYMTFNTPATRKTFEVFREHNMLNIHIIFYIYID
jgi:hypothetical protein